MDKRPCEHIKSSKTTKNNKQKKERSIILCGPYICIWHNTKESNTWSNLWDEKWQITMREVKPTLGVCIPTAQRIKNLSLISIWYEIRETGRYLYPEKRGSSRGSFIPIFYNVAFDRILRSNKIVNEYIENGCFIAYADDILVYVEDDNPLILQELHKVFIENGMQINRSKCEYLSKKPVE